MYASNVLLKDTKKNKDFFNGYKHVYVNILGDLQPLEVIEYDEFLFERYRGYYDIYVTENSISNVYSRSNEDVLQFRALYIDIDKVEDINKTISNINTLVEKNKIPIPNTIIFSGRGIHVKWFLKDYAATSKKNTKVWERLQGYLYKTLKSLGADAKAKDSSRVLRVVGSINSKSDEPVRVLVDNKLEPYDLYELYNTYTPYKPLEAKGKKGSVKLLTTKRTLNNARLKDLEMLLELRDYDMSGIRNSFLMFYTTYYILVNETGFDETLQEIKIIASRVKSKKYTSLNELKSFVRNGLKKVQAHKEGHKVLPKSETIIEWLDITEDEQMQLITLKSKEIKYKKNNEARREKRKNENGLTNRDQEKKNKIIKIQKLKAKGLSQSNVSKQSGYSIALVKRYWNI